MQKITQQGKGENTTEDQKTIIGINKPPIQRHKCAIQHKVINILTSDIYLTLIFLKEKTLRIFGLHNRQENVHSKNDNYQIKRN